MGLRKFFNSFKVTSFITFSFLVMSTNLMEGKEHYKNPVGDADKARLEIQHKLTVSPVERAFKNWKSMGLIPASSAGKTVVDFGCGAGAPARERLLRHFKDAKYVGVDFARESILSSIRKLVGQDEVPAYEDDQAVFQVSDDVYVWGDEKDEKVAEWLRKADVVFLRFVIQHQPNPEKFVNRLLSLMKPGAIFITFDPYSNVNLVSEHLPDDLRTTVLKKFDIKFELGQKAGIFPNFASNIHPILSSSNDWAFLYFEENIHFPLEKAKYIYLPTFNYSDNNPVVTDLGMSKEKMDFHTAVLSKEEYAKEEIYIGDLYGNIAIIND